VRVLSSKAAKCAAKLGGEVVLRQRQERPGEIGEVGPPAGQDCAEAVRGEVREVADRGTDGNVRAAEATGESVPANRGQQSGKEQRVAQRAPGWQDSKGPGQRLVEEVGTLGCDDGGDDR